jgi:hypothetical protein
VAKLGPWICDTCSKEVTVEDGVVVWASTSDGEGDFRIIHKDVCDPGNRTHMYWLGLARLMGPDGLSRLLSYFSAGPVLKASGSSTEETPIADFEDFVDLIRRIQLPGYEQARRWFDDPEILEEFESLSESGAYYEEMMDLILDKVASRGTESEA